METELARTRRARRVHRLLAERYPDAHCELDFTSPFELLVATVLSAQCTDARVNQVTPALFAAVAANEAERAAPGVTLVDVSMIGAAGRIYLSGPAAEVRRAQREITEVLAAVAGRDQ